METKINHIHVSELNAQLVSLTIENIEKFANKNQYQLKDWNNITNITPNQISAGIINMSKKKKKKLASMIKGIEISSTLKKANMFLHFLMKNVLGSDLRAKVILSEKEVAIQKKRAEYKAQLEKLKAAYADYKNEKGDFYKLRLGK
jgi:hypothetical protein